MRRTTSKTFSPLALIAWMACAHTGSAPVPPSSSAQVSAKTSGTSLTNTLRLTAERAHEGHRASATVLVRHSDSPPGGTSPHLKLAGSRAWLALSSQRAAAQDWSGAVACAQAGLDELGRSYVSRGVYDDSDLKLGVAQDQLKRGDAQNAAGVLLDVLTARIALYVKLHADAIVE